MGIKPFLKHLNALNIYLNMYLAFYLINHNNIIFYSEQFK